MSEESGTRQRNIPPELDLIILSFFLHFAWEFAQVPLFEDLPTRLHIQGIIICSQATVGDVMIALAAFWAAALVSRSRRWVAKPRAAPLIVYLGTGLLLTVSVEYLSTEVLDLWAYGPDMPRLPYLGTGLSPLLQWSVIPLIVYWYLKRLAKP